MNGGQSQHHQTWSEVLDTQVKLLHGQIAGVLATLEKSGADAALAERLCAPYYHLLERLYEEEFPIVRAIETSDLLLQLEGRAVRGRKPRVSLIATVFSSVRRQVGSVAYALSGVVGGPSSLPRDVDLGLSACALGSLYLGFSLPDLSAEGEDGERSVLGPEDPLYKATREAIRTLGIVSKQIDDGAALQDLEGGLPDPKVRDVALAAIQHLAPTGMTGIDLVRVSGREMPEGLSSSLTPDLRKKVRGWIEHPVRSAETGEFIGIVREIDLDLRRLEIRRLVGTSVEEIRCVYPPELAGVAEQALDEKVKAFGRIDRSADGKPKMLEVERLEVVGAAPAAQATFDESL